MVATGNEADLHCADFIDHLIDQPEVRAIALFAETIRHAPSFTAAAGARSRPQADRRAEDRPVRGHRALAQAHTGSLVGDDRVFDGVCRQLGIVRVNSIEDLLFTADVITRTGVLQPRGLGSVSISGGACEIVGRSRAGAERAAPALSDAARPRTARRAAELRHAAQSARHHRRRGAAAGSFRTGPAHHGPAAGILRARLPVRRAGRRGPRDRVRADGAAPHRGGTARRRRAGADDQPHGEAGDRGLHAYHRGDRSALCQRRHPPRHDRARPGVLVVGAVSAARRARRAVADRGRASGRDRNARRSITWRSAVFRWCRRRWRATRIRRSRRRARSADPWC